MKNDENFEDLLQGYEDITSEENSADALTKEEVQNKEIIENQKEISSELDEIEKELKKPKKKMGFNKKIFAIIAIVLVFIIVGTTVGYGLILSDKAEKEKIRIESMQKMHKQVNLGNNLRANAIKTVKKQESIPAYSLSQINKMDMRKPSGATVADLKLVTRQNLVGLEKAFVKAEKRYGVNSLFLIAIASMESANGTICFKPNNMFGYGSKGYPSKEACIYDVAKGLSNNYLKPGASLYNGTKISDVNKRYASSSTWDSKVANNMHSYYSIISARRKKAIRKLTK